MSQPESAYTSPPDRKGKKYNNLKDVVANPWKVDSTIGVIIDATGDYKTDDSFDYVTKIRIIDDKLNPNKESGGKKKGHVMVFIFSSKLASTPNINKVGNIILLRNFKFDNYKDIVKGVNLKVGSEWQVFENQMNCPIEAIDSNKSIPSVLNVTEKEAIKRLKDWSQSFLSRNSLLKLNWFQREVKSKRSANELLYKKDIDLLVRVIQSVRTIINENVYDRVVFVDKNRKKYFAEIKNSGLDFNDKKVVKLRSISITETDNDSSIIFYNYSKILVLDNNFFDARELIEKTKDIKFAENLLVKSFIQEFHLEKYKFDEIAPQTYLYYLDRANIDFVAEEVKQFLSAYPILMDFDTTCMSLKPDKEETFYGSCIMKKHSELPVKTVDDLNKLLLSCGKNNKLLEKNKNNVFVVEGSINEFKYQKFNEMFKIYSPSSNQTWELSDLEKAVENGLEDLRIMAHNIIFLNNTETGEGELPLYVATFDKNPQFLFDVWRILPDFSVIRDWNIRNSEFKKKMTSFMKYLNRLSNSKATFRFAVQLTTSDDETCYFRIIDSIFWFLSN